MGAPPIAGRAGTVVEAAPPRSAAGIGHLLAAAGAIALIVSLFLTWYEVELPAAARSMFEAQTNTLPAESQALTQAFGTALLSAFESVDMNGWQAFEMADIALLGCGIAAVGAILVSLGLFGSRSRALDAAAIVSLAGAAAGALVVVKALDQPEPARLFGLGPGPLVALVGAAAMVLGGRLQQIRR
jgi:hypothetical protein